MNDTPDKVEPEELELRARPRPIKRLNRRALYLSAATVALFIGGAALVALNPPRLSSNANRPELYNTDRKQTADGLSKLPKAYNELPVPKLGPPAAGDLGRAFVDSETRLGAPQEVSGSYRPDAEQDAERAERIRQARISQQAKESGLFFRLSEKQERRKQSAGSGAATGQAGAFRPTSTDGAAGQSGVLAQPTRGLSDRSNELIPPSQVRKLALLAEKPDKETTSPHQLAAPPSVYAVMAGSIIPASLVTGLNSDLPGSAIAQVTENVYDTVTGDYLLIPQGTKLIGKYDSVIAHGQKRALVIWSRLILPNGNSIVIDNLPASDVAGYSGLEDQVDLHTFQLLKGIALATMLGVGTQLTLGNDEGDLVKALRESVQQTTNRAGQRIVERELDVQPTITIRPGWPMRVIVSKDLVLKPYEFATADKGK